MITNALKFLKKFLKANMSYMVLAPKSTKVDPYSMKKYYAVMQEFKDGIKE